MEDTTEIAGVSVPSPISMQVAPSTSTSSSRCRNRLRCIARLTCTSPHRASTLTPLQEQAALHCPADLHVTASPLTAPALCCTSAWQRSEMHSP